MEKQNNIWFEDANVLFSKYNFFDIIPLVDMSFSEKINAITRFAIYLSILLIIFTGNLNYLYLPICIVLLFYLMYIFRPKRKEKFEDNESEDSNNTNDNANVNNNANANDNENAQTTFANIENTQANIEPSIDLSKCRNPTENNPLMNLQISDYTSSDNRRACNVNNPEISNKIDNSFDDKLYLNTEVVYNTKFNQRDFYTMPNTRPYNDQGAFANWLYNTPVSCAQGNEQELKQARACAFTNKQLEEMNL